MGVVHRALDERTGRVVALKLMLDAGPDEAARLAREVGALASLDHPGIVAVRDVGRAGERAYLAMELVEGTSLAQRLRAGPLPVAEAVDVVGQVAAALAHAHGRGVLHRDVKPANVLLDRAGRARLADFGLARRAGDARLTATGELLGTPAYMAPEQANADRARVGPWSDVWALGAVLHEALTGRAPFGGATALATLAAVLEAAPAPVSALRPGVPPDLEALCLRCLDKDPARRPAAAEVAQALSRSRGRPRPRRASARARRRALAATAAALVLLAAGAWAVRQGDPEVAFAAQGHGAEVGEALREVGQALRRQAGERLARGDLAGAATDLERAGTLAPDPEADAPLELDLALARGDLAGAGAALERLPLTARGAARARVCEGWLARGAAALDAGDLPGAGEALSSAAALEPARREVRRLARAVARAAVDRSRTQEERVAQALAVTPALAAETWVFVAQDAPVPAEGRRLAARALAAAPPPAWRLHAHLLLDADDQVSALLAEADRLVVEAPGDARAWLVRGLLRARAGALDAAGADLERARALTDDPELAVEALMALALVLGDAAHARRACELAPELARTWAAHGYLLLHVDPAGAIESLERALALDARQPTALKHRGEAGLLVEDFAGARAALDRLLALDPDNDDAHVWLCRGVARVRLGDPGGLTDVDRALDLEPGRADYREVRRRLAQGR
ncbi:MAG: protein kinase [Planctomycetes bacterium]|nr:protein kinase [Planctomycetota bacterium]